MAKQRLKPLKKTPLESAEKGTEKVVNESTGKANKTSEKVLASPPPPPLFHPAKKEKQYWNRYVHIPGIGTVSGEATEEQIKAFNKWAGGAAKIEKFLGNIDIIKAESEKRKEAARKKMGLV